LTGTGRIAGFSLVEALVTLLVLSIGLLGLGRLQAQLWRGSGNLHAAADASLLADNLLEIDPVDWLPETGKNALYKQSGEHFSITIKQFPESTPSENLTSTHLELRWWRPSGELSLQRTITRNDNIAPQDARWLLPSP